MFESKSFFTVFLASYIKSKATVVSAFLLVLVFSVGTLSASEECSEDFWSEITPVELLESYEVDEEILNSTSCGTQGNTALHIAARYTSYPSIIKVLMLMGADINAENEEGQSVLEYASDNDNPSVYQTVLRAVEVSEGSAPEVSADRDAELEAVSKAVNNKNLRGWYVGFHTGMAIPTQTLNVDFTSPDRPTNCDVFLVGTVPASQKCSSSDIWEDKFKLGKGINTGASVGYAWKNLRAEAELSYQTHSGSLGESAGYEDLHAEATKSAEFVESWQAMKSVNSTTLGGNLYYDFNGISVGKKLKIRPFVGAGLGVSELSMDYNAIWHRNPNAAVLEGLGKTPKAAGTLSGVRSKNLRDRIYTPRFMVGLDIPISRRVTIGVEGRYSRLIGGGFSKDVETYDVLRSHASRLSPAGKTVGYSVMVPKHSNASVRVNVKFYLGKLGKTLLGKKKKKNRKLKY